MEWEKKQPDKMYIVRDKHVIISTFSQELKEQKESNIELVKALNYLYTRTVPGYKNIGTYRKEYRWTGNICNPVYILCTGR